MTPLGAPKPRKVKAPRVEEKHFQKQVLDLAELYRWRWFHNPDSRKVNPGLPDLILIREGECVFAELKASDGKVSDEQREVVALLESSPVEVYVWFPKDFESQVVPRLTKPPVVKLLNR